MKGERIADGAHEWFNIPNVQGALTVKDPNRALGRRRMTDLPIWLKEQVLRMYEQSSYANFLRVEILELCAGETTFAMKVRHELTNLSGILHGGAVGSLIDMAMNLACFSLGKQATVLGFNTNFLLGAKEGDTVKASAKVLHNGKSTMVVESRVTDHEGKLLAKARGTFFVVGLIIPEKS